jgi:hypothetical protein
MEFCCGRPVEADQLDFRVGVEEGAKIVRYGIVRDRGIETTGARRGR